MISKRTSFGLLFLFLFLLRLTFGLCEAKWWEKDEIQTYLIGLKCYTTATWPYFGPDVNGDENRSFNSQIPGALEGLVIGLPFYALPIPETPFIALSLMSTIGAALLAWYIRRRIPNLSFPWLFIWIAITPWSLYEGTHVINPAYNFLPSILFFIGFLETLPSLSTRWLRPFWANAWMGFSLFWVMQFHFSYVYLVPLAAFSLLYQLWKEHRWVALFHFAAGAAPMAALIVPTLVKYGLDRGNVASGFAVPFDWYNVTEWVTILARYFSLVCFELPRFIGRDTHERLQFLTDHPLLTIPCAVLWVGGIVQALVMLLCWFKKPSLLPQAKWFFVLSYLLIWVGIYVAGNRPYYVVFPLAALIWFLGRLPALAPFFKWFQKPVSLPAWKEMNLLVLLVYLMVWASFWFTIKMPMSHIYFVLYPMIMVYSCCCWSLFADNPKWRLAAKVFLLMGIYFQVGFSLVVAKADSLYNKREPVARAIQEKNYHLAGERRPESLY